VSGQQRASCRHGLQHLVTVPDPSLYTNFTCLHFSLYELFGELSRPFVQTILPHFSSLTFHEPFALVTLPSVLILAKYMVVRCRYLLRDLSGIDKVPVKSVTQFIDPRCDFVELYFFSFPVLYDC